MAIAVVIIIIASLVWDAGNSQKQNYSGASLNGPSEKRITSQQRTYLQERNDFP